VSTHDTSALHVECRKNTRLCTYLGISGGRSTFFEVDTLKKIVVITSTIKVCQINNEKLYMTFDCSYGRSIRSSSFSCGCATTCVSAATYSSCRAPVPLLAGYRRSVLSPSRAGLSRVLLLSNASAAATLKLDMMKPYDQIE
jgi:hypothetical protein